MLSKHRLMVPGPTPLPPEVSAAACLPIEDERTHDFAGLFTRMVDNLRRVLRTRNQVLVFTSSMTGAFEGAVQNLFSPGERVLVAENGAFGRRWVDMCRAFGLDVVEHSAGWGDDLDIARVAETLAADPAITAAICVHCETSTGVVNDVEAFAAAASGVLTVVDSASGVGACELRTDEWGVDVVVGGGQKALMTPPGLAFASVSPRAWRRHAEARLPRFYFDWTQTRQAYDSDIPRTPWTPAISLLVQFDQALRLLLEEGLDEALRRHVLLGRVARAGLQGMGLELLAPARDRNATVTTALMPAGIDSEEVVRRVRQDYGVQIVGGGGPLAGRVVRVGHCGYVDTLDVLATIAALELTLHTMGAPVRPGAGAAGAVQTLTRDGELIARAS
ncbi:alanine--glyoxylate aminotransferase family protein [Nonomuraea sp. NPDC050643]|uniref:pyridoxal-phosphate-dependent aminotransferase family protein n=1 Tax=Nonomuraea sp. NPDC050643 TaxID=3155660 RepID=UPI0033C53A14